MYIHMVFPYIEFVDVSVKTHALVDHVSLLVPSITKQIKHFLTKM